MKKISIVLGMFIVIVFCSTSCGSGGDNPKSNGGDPTADPDYKAGLALTAEHNCVTCHRPLEPFTGPSYADISEKYRSDKKNIPMLAEKIIKGGSGNWGTAPMIPHPDVSQQDAETMVKYIFLIKK